MRFILELSQEGAADYWRAFSAALKRMGRREIAIDDAWFAQLQGMSRDDLAKPRSDNARSVAPGTRSSRLSSPGRSRAGNRDESPTPRLSLRAG